jgi:hypothetical protein
MRRLTDAYLDALALAALVILLPIAVWLERRANRDADE